MISDMNHRLKNCLSKEKGCGQIIDSEKLDSRGICCVSSCGITWPPDAHGPTQTRENRYGGAGDSPCRGECGRPEERQLCSARDSKGSDMIQTAYRGGGIQGPCQ